MSFNSFQFSDSILFNFGGLERNTKQYLVFKFSYMVCYCSIFLNQYCWLLFVGKRKDVNLTDLRDSLAHKRIKWRVKGLVIDYYE